MSAERLIKLLSTAFRKDRDSNNYKLLKVLTEGFDEIEEQLEFIKQMHSLETAYGNSLDHIAALFNIRRRQNETDEELRYRIILERMKQLSCGTKQDIIDVLKFIGLSEIQIKEPPNEDPATFRAILNAYEVFDLTTATYVGYGLGSYGAVPYGGLLSGRRNSEILLDILNAIKAAGIKALLHYNYPSGLTTLSSANNAFSLEIISHLETICNASNIFDLTVKGQTETKCYAEVKLGYGFWGYGEYGYGGVW